jgi:hypothetical protein
MEPTPIPTPHSPEPPRRWFDGPGLAQVDRSLWRLILAIAITVASMVIAAEAGVVLAAFGLGGLVLGLAAVLLVAGILVRRQAMLPLGLVAATLAVPAAVTAHQQRPLDRSAGLLTVTPQTAAQLDGKTYRRGIGSIFLDLRQMRAQGERQIAVTATADVGMIVVALPRDKCLNLNVQAERGPGIAALPNAALGQIGRTSVPLRSIFPDEATDALRHRPTEAISEQPSSSPAVLFAYGRGVHAESGGTRYRRWVRPNVPTVNLTLAASQPIVVRDYPDAIGPLTAAARSGPQVGDINWPRMVRLPPRPDDQDWRNRWLSTWTASQVANDIPQLWAKWERATIMAQQRQASRIAGACATPAELRSTWVTAQYHDLQPDGMDAKGNPLYDGAAGTVDEDGGFVPPMGARGYQIAVNGLGDTEYSEYDVNGTVRVSKVRPSHAGASR